MNYFISDVHQGHNNILKFNRQGNDSWRSHGYFIYDQTENFIGIDTYNQFIVDSWNKVVTNNDDVFILGDLYFGEISTVGRYFGKLNGKNIYVVRGNHDSEKSIDNIYHGCFHGHKWVDEQTSLITIPDKKLVLSHYPVFDFDRAKRGFIHLFGHIHNGYDLNTIYANSINSLSNFYSVNIKAFNVGACCPWMNYTPKTVEQIEKDYSYFIDNKTNVRY
jgi:calcineurin-like phosphoesterase family protein